MGARSAGGGRLIVHDDQPDLRDAVALGLISSQFPEWASLTVRRVHSSSGTVNVIFQIGDGFAARFPLRATDPVMMRQLLEAEARASTEFARGCPFPSPLPVALGEPGLGYPLPWSVQTWLSGADFDRTPGASRSEALARDLADLVGALRHVSTAGRQFSGPGRGGDLRDHDEWVELCLRRSEHLLDVKRLESLWLRFRELPRTAPDVMSHGDLIPGNVLLDLDTGGGLAGVLDCGGFGPADPALDVIAGWHLLDDEARELFRSRLACDDLEWERSKAWALQQSLGAVWYYENTNPAMYEMGRRTLDRIVAHSPV